MKYKVKNLVGKYVFTNSSACMRVVSIREKNGSYILSTISTHNNAPYDISIDDVLFVSKDISGVTKFEDGIDDIKYDYDVKLLDIENERNSKIDEYISNNKSEIVV